MTVTLAPHAEAACMWLDVIAINGTGQEAYRLDHLVSTGTHHRNVLLYCSEACQRAHWLAGHKDNCLFSFIE